MHQDQDAAPVPSLEHNDRFEIELSSKRESLALSSGIVDALMRNGTRELAPERVGHGVSTGTLLEEPLCGAGEGGDPTAMVVNCALNLLQGGTPGARPMPCRCPLAGHPGRFGRACCAAPSCTPARDAAICAWSSRQRQKLQCSAEKNRLHQNPCGATAGIRLNVVVIRASMRAGGTPAIACKSGWIDSGVFPAPAGSSGIAKGVCAASREELLEFPFRGTDEGFSAVHRFVRLPGRSRRAH